MVEQGRVADRRQPPSAGREAELLALAPRDRVAVLEEERDVDRRLAVEPLGELAHALAAGGSR